jgi:hypothetical protein
METLDRASVLADTLAAGCACDQAADLPPWRGQADWRLFGQIASRFDK